MRMLVIPNGDDARQRFIDFFKEYGFNGQVKGHNLVVTNWDPERLSDEAAVKLAGLQGSSMLKMEILD